eukprot:7386919-Prymnesium_polylepis.1
MSSVGMSMDFLNREVNSGFSGGEKKRNEILQMALLEPELAILVRAAPPHASRAAHPTEPVSPRAGLRARSEREAGRDGLGAGHRRAQDGRGGCERVQERLQRHRADHALSEAARLHQARLRAHYVQGPDRAEWRARAGARAREGWLRVPRLGLSAWRGEGTALRRARALRGHAARTARTWRVRRGGRRDQGRQDRAVRRRAARL